MLVASYEAEQHLLHFGRSDVPVCWTICGLTSGYLSRSAGKEIYVLEDRCMGKGDAACHLLGRTREEWGDERAEELRFFEPNRLKECLDVSLHRVTETLKAAERKLREHRRALVRVAPRRRGAAGDRRQEPRDAAARGPGAPRGQGRLHRPHHRRERIGQGADRAARPRGVDARGGAVHRGQLRRHHRDAPRERALRARARRVHRRDPGPAGPVRGGQRRDAAARRGRRGLAGHAGQAPAGAPGAGDPARRREQEPAGRRARRGRHQPRPRPRGRGRRLPAGPLLPAQGRRAARAAAARAQGRHPAARPGAARGRGAADEAQDLGPRPGRRRSAPALRVAGQRARARERHGARRRARARKPRGARGPARGDPPGVPQARGHQRERCGRSTRSRRSTSSRRWS